MKHYIPTYNSNIHIRNKISHTISSLFVPYIPTVLNLLFRHTSWLIIQQVCYPKECYPKREIITKNPNELFSYCSCYELQNLIAFHALSFSKSNACHFFYKHGLSLKHFIFLSLTGLSEIDFFFMKALKSRKFFEKFNRIFINHQFS